MVDTEHLKIFDTYREGSCVILVLFKIRHTTLHRPNVQVLSTHFKVHVLLKLLNGNLENWKAGSKLNILS